MTDNDRPAQRARAGQWLREQRKRRGFPTAAEFARALGIDKGLVSNYEVGRSTVPDESAERMAEVLGMDVIEVRRGLGLWVPREAEDKVSAREVEPEYAPGSIRARVEELIRRRKERQLNWALKAIEDEGDRDAG